MALFAKQFKVHKKWLVGSDGIPIEEFLQMVPEDTLYDAQKGHFIV
jgi:hypothetical protein